MSKAEAGASPPKIKLKYVNLEGKIVRAYQKHVGLSEQFDTNRLLRLVRYNINVGKKRINYKCTVISVKAFEEHTTRTFKINSQKLNKF